MTSDFFTAQKVEEKVGMSNGEYEARYAIRALIPES
jgi:hypothetical protein